MSNPIILGLDASSTAVGWCVAQGDRYVDSSVFRPKGLADERIVAIVDWFAEQVTTHDPDWVAIELPTGMHANPHTDRLLARVLGNIEGAAQALGLRTMTVHAMTVKATGFNKNRPELAAMLVGKTEVAEDEADAIGVWQAALGELQKMRLESLVG